MLNNQKSPISVIVPAYNEDASVGKVVSNLIALELFREIVVVDDGSNDFTALRFLPFLDRKEVVTLINHKNRGKGYSVLKGLQRVTAPYVVLQDADLEYPVSNLEKLVEYLDYDMTVGVRNTNGQGIYVVSAASFLVNKMITRLMKVPDVMSGQRMLRTEFARSLNLKAGRFEIETEMTLKALEKGAKIKFVPIEYYPRTEGKKIGCLDFLKVFKTYLSFKIACLF